MEWYHNALCYPGETLTELSIARDFYWKNLCKTIHEVCSKCKGCQFLKRNKKQYGKLPPKEVESKPWDVLCVDVLGQYQFTSTGGGMKYQMTTKKWKGCLFTGSHNDRSSYRPDRNSHGTLYSRSFCI